MTAGSVASGSEEQGPGMMALIEELYPLCRSLTGDGVRETLQRIGERIPLETREVPTGERVLDWEVPKEWNVREGWIEDPDGERVVDFADHTLHLVGHSVPIRRRLSLEELRPHLHSIPEHPDWIPYRTSYYEEDWGFCLRHRTLEALEPGEYEVRIDADLEPGSLTYGECVVPGATHEEVIVSAHCCHPSLANDNLSGIAVATHLARWLSERSESRYTYRFLFAPGTLGTIAWLARNETGAVRRLRHGLVLSGVGMTAPLTYKRSRRDDAEVDAAAGHVLRTLEEETRIVPFSPTGYDERQYGSPGFNLPVGRLSRGLPGAYPEYHTSADDLDFVDAGALAGSLHACREIVEVLEGNGRYRNLQPRGEPQLGRRELYRDTGGERLPDFESALLWVLSLSDGEHSLLEVAERSGLAFAAIRQAADALLDADLLEPTDAP